MTPIDLLHHPDVQKARLIAKVAHAAVGQKRKYTGDAYIVHPNEVANIVAHVPNATILMVQVALLHDVIDDTEIELPLIADELGWPVAEGVRWLSDSCAQVPPDANRKTRKAACRDFLAQAPGDMQTVKLADLFSNSAQILARDPNFSRIYLPEKFELLRVLTRGDVELWTRCHNVVIDAARAHNINLTGAA